MKIKSELETMFTVPEGHKPVAIVAGGTDHAHFKRVWDGMVEEEIYADMDGNASAKNIPLSPVMVLIVQSDTDNHLHAIVSLPLQKWQDGLAVEETIENSKNFHRVADWCAGFIETFCMNNSVMAIDLTNDKVIVGDGDKNVMSLEATVKNVRPQREVRGLESIGDADDILGQLSKPQIEKFSKKAAKKAPENMTRISVKEEAAEKEPTMTDGIEKMLKEQEAIVKKYGYKALKDMADRMNMPLLVSEPKA